MPRRHHGHVMAGISLLILSPCRPSVANAGIKPPTVHLALAQLNLCSGSRCCQKYTATTLEAAEPLRCHLFSIKPGPVNTNSHRHVVISPFLSNFRVSLTPRLLNWIWSIAPGIQTEIPSQWLQPRLSRSVPCSGLVSQEVISEVSTRP